MMKLSSVERGVLIALAAAGTALRDVDDLDKRLRIRATPTSLKKLAGLGLIRAMSGEVRAHELTEAGWCWLEEEASAAVPAGSISLGPLYALLAALARAIKQRKLDIRSFLHETPAANAPTAAGPAAKSPAAAPTVIELPEQSNGQASALSEAAWSDSEVALAYALQDIPSFTRVLDRFDGASSDKQAKSLRQVELAAQSIFQNLRLAAARRGLSLTHERGATAEYDPVAFECSEPLSLGEHVIVVKSPVVKNSYGSPIVVAKGIADPTS
jgi:hypothetical protein